MEDGRLTKKMFNHDFDLCKNNWSSQTKKIFSKLDMMEFYNNKESCDLDIVKEKLYTIMEQEWEKDVHKKPKLRKYVTFKESIATEDYTKYITSRQSRSLLAQFRSGILPLKIETGRFKNLDVSERLCELCDLEEIEDEMHFLCVCPLYRNERL